MKLVAIARVRNELDIIEALVYPDVAQAIREGMETSAYDHFVKCGYGEGRPPRPVG